MRNIRIVLLLSILTFFSCDSNNPVTGTGNRSNITGTSGCGGFDRVKLENSLIINRDDNKTYFYYEYHANKLYITRYNAGFNCCLAENKTSVLIDDNEITIEEIEEGSPCDCLCLYDYTLEIKNLPAATYSVNVIELHSVSSDPPVAMTIDLINNPSGEFEFLRSHYPWGF